MAIWERWSGEAFAPTVFVNLARDHDTGAAVRAARFFVSDEMDPEYFGPVRGIAVAVKRPLIRSSVEGRPSPFVDSDGERTIQRRSRHMR